MSLRAQDVIAVGDTDLSVIGSLHMNPRDFLPVRRIARHLLAKGPELMNKTIVMEVIESHNCNSMHKVGDRLVFDGAGNLITKLCPKRVCIYALSSAAKVIFASNELLYAGVDLNEIRFKRTGCFDVGVECGGWGHIVMELKVEERGGSVS